jgi:hypothetical protein
MVSCLEGSFVLCRCQNHFRFVWCQELCVFCSCCDLIVGRRKKTIVFFGLSFFFHMSISNIQIRFTVLVDPICFMADSTSP